ncbi:hypothetical protein OFN54_29935, partial [Escherichia coli]|nr:hypothetical protein [Escherichia coli]
MNKKASLAPNKPLIAARQVFTAHIVLIFGIFPTQWPFVSQSTPYSLLSTSPFLISIILRTKKRTHSIFLFDICANIS